MMNISARDLIRLVVSSGNTFLYQKRDCKLQSVGTYSLLHTVCLPRVILCTAIFPILLEVRPFV